MRTGSGSRVASPAARIVGLGDAGGRGKVSRAWFSTCESIPSGVPRNFSKSRSCPRSSRAGSLTQLAEIRQQDVWTPENA